MCQGARLSGSILIISGLMLEISGPIQAYIILPSPFISSSFPLSKQLTAASRLPASCSCNSNAAMLILPLPINLRQAQSPAKQVPRSKSEGTEIGRNLLAGTDPQLELDRCDHGAIQTISDLNVPC